MRLSQTVEQLTLDIGALAQKVNALADITARHERRWERVRRVMQAALQAGLGDDGDQQEA
jgi:hypothetical protein